MSDNTNEEEVPIWIDWVELEVAHLTDDEVQDYIDHWSARHAGYERDQATAGEGSREAHRAGHSAWNCSKKISIGLREQERRAWRKERGLEAPVVSHRESVEVEDPKHTVQVIVQSGNSNSWNVHCDLCTWLGDIAGPWTDRDDAERKTREHENNPYPDLIEWIVSFFRAGKEFNDTRAEERRSRSEGGKQ